MSETWADAQARMDVGERLFSTVEHGDLEELRNIFAEGAAVWHNTDDKLTTVDQTIRNLTILRSWAKELRYTEVRREPTPTGFAQQHVLIVVTPNGETIRDMCACICRVENGRLAHMDAYHDSAATGRMAHHMSAAVQG